MLFWIFCDTMSLNVKMYLWLKLYTVPFFVSGQTNKINKGSNNYCSHCILSGVTWKNSASYQNILAIWITHSQNKKVLWIKMTTPQAVLENVDWKWVISVQAWVSTKASASCGEENKGSRLPRWCAQSTSSGLDKLSVPSSSGINFVKNSVWYPSSIFSGRLTILTFCCLERASMTMTFRRSASFSDCSASALFSPCISSPSLSRYYLHVFPFSRNF